MKTFKIGGVHPAENKLSADQSIKVMEVPKQAFIPLNQNMGAPAKSLINKGDEVKVGQLIGRGEAFISSNVHSSVSGKVLKIDNVIDASGYKKPTVVVNVEGDIWEDSIDRSKQVKKEITLTQKEIIEKIKEMGIVGLGGATFPSHVKLMVPDGKKADVLLINGVECEPYLTADQRLMLSKGEEILVGTTILMRGLGVNRAYIGIENNKPEAIKHLSELAKGFESIEIVPLKVKYPQGGEKQLIKAIINREVPSAKLPIEVGAVVNNIGTTYAVYEAVQKNKPLFERIVTVTGKHVSKPSNFLARIGTPISELIEAAGGVPENTAKIISGGPMMGKALLSIETPVVKGTSGVLLLDKKEAVRNELKACIRCGRCITVCPMGLEPVLLSQLSRQEMYENAEKENIMDCMECGSCHYTCPSDRPLLDYLRLGKNKVGQIIRNRGKK